MQLPDRKNRIDGLQQFAEELKKIDRQVGFKISARGWCYQLEGFRLINKDQFNKVENLINECRSNGFLPIDFTAEEEGRRFSGVDLPEDATPKQYLGRILYATLRC